MVVVVAQVFEGGGHSHTRAAPKWALFAPAERQQG